MTRLSDLGRLAPLAVAALIVFGGTACAGGSGASAGSAPPLGATALAGRDLADRQGCAGCHSANGESSVGPTWKGIWHTDVRLTDGSSAFVDPAYIARSIAHPDAQVVHGFQPIMPPFDLSRAQVAELVAYIQALR